MLRFLTAWAIGVFLFGYAYLYPVEFGAWLGNIIGGFRFAAFN